MKVLEEGKCRGRQADLQLHGKIYQLRVINGLSISDTAKLTDVSTKTVIRIAKKLKSGRLDVQKRGLPILSKCENAFLIKIRG